VDSDAALAAWAANTAGNDYTSVLIAPGTWTSGVTVNLTTSGTKVVVGMPGSKLSFTSTSGLRYSTLPTSKDYHMEGVTVEVVHDESAQCFNYCANLTGCTATATNSSSNSGAYGFRYSDNLINCTATSNGGSGAARGYTSCENITNCYAYATNSGGNSSVGFSSCQNLTSCRAQASGVSARGFSGCKGMLLNRNSTEYESCFVSRSGTGAAPADTAAGGWNW
jgi:hypothetical protein